MQPGAVTEEVQVVADAPLVETALQARALRFRVLF